MNDPARQIERAAENYVRQIDSANRGIADLIKTIQEIEQLAAVADGLDLRRAIGAKSDLNSLMREVDELKRNVQTLSSALADTHSRIYKALI